MAGITSVSDTDVQLCEHCSRCNTKLRINIFFLSQKTKAQNIEFFYVYDFDQRLHGFLSDTCFQVFHG